MASLTQIEAFLLLREWVGDADRKGNKGLVAAQGPQILTVPVEI